MVSVKQIEKGLASYLDAEFLPKVHVEKWKEFAIATVTSIMIKRVGNAIGAVKNNKALSMFGIVDDEGNIDLDILAEQAKANMPKEGLSIELPMIGEVTLFSSDIDTLYRNIVGGA